MAGNGQAWEGSGVVGSDDWEPPPDGSVVELSVPARHEFLDAVRTATAGLAARLSLTAHDIEDLRTSVNEACTMVLALPRPRGAEDAMLTCRYQIRPDALIVRVSTPVDGPAQLPARGSFEWRELATHDIDVRWAVDDGHAWIELRKSRR